MAYFRNSNTIHCNRSNKMQTQIKFIQINLQHSGIEPDNLMTITEHSTDILCIQEQYKIQTKMVGLLKKYKIFASGEGRIRAAIVVTNNRVDTILIKQLSVEDTVVLEIIIDNKKLY